MTEQAPRPIEPRASGADLSAIIARNPNPDRRYGIAAAAALSTALVGAGIASAQEASVDPSLQPIFSPEASASIDPCASPFPSEVPLASGDLVVFPSESPFASPSPLISPEPSITPDPCASPEVEANTYSPDSFLSNNIKNINPDQIENIIKEKAKFTAKYIKEKYNPDYSTAEEIKYLTDLFSKNMKETDFDVNGIRIARQLANMVYDANKMKTKGYEKAAEAYMDVTQAFYRRGYTILRDDNGEQIDPTKYNNLILNSYESLMAEDLG